MLHMNGLFVFSDSALVELPLNDEGISGGGKVEPLVKGAAFDDVS